MRGCVRKRGVSLRRETPHPLLRDALSHKAERAAAYNARTCQNRSVRRAFSDVIRA